MSILNRASDGLPSVLVVLVRTLRKIGPMERGRLETLIAPSSLQQVSTTFDNGKMVRQTLNRWIQIGLFVEEDGQISLAKGYEEGATEGIVGLRTLGRQLRQLVLVPDNNDDLLRPEPNYAADFTHAVCWMLAQDPFHLTTGSYVEHINHLESGQFSEEPWAFRNDTRWAGFLDWAPLLGFGWNAHVPKAKTFIIDPTEAVDDALPWVFDDRHELSQSDFFHALADALPVVDGGAYRSKVEARLAGNTWRPTGRHEVSPSLSLSLFRLQEAGVLMLESRSDAPYRTLLGQGFAEVRKVSHLRFLEDS
jgi:hypothetical protein